MKKARLKDNRIYLKIGGDGFELNKLFIKAIPGRKYHAELTEWSIPYTDTNVQMINEAQFDLSADLAVDVAEEVDEAWRQMPTPPIPMINGKHLYPFQEDTLKFVSYHGNRAVLALPMGLGKTIIALSFLKMLPDSLPALVICPSPVKGGFLRDYEKFFGNSDDVVILSGMDSLAKYKREKIYVINYEILSRGVIKKKIKKGKRTVPHQEPSEELLRFIKTGFRAVVADECHRLKNEESNAYYAYNLLMLKAEYGLGLSGTPILSRPSEIWAYWNILKPGVFVTKQAFLNRYCEPQQLHIGGGRRIMTYNGATNLLELNRKLRNNGMIVFNKTEVLKDLPDEPIKTVVPIELDSYQRYLDVKTKVLEEISENKKHALTLFETLKQASVKQKMNHVYDYLDTMLESENKIVVFAEHQKVIEELHKRYKNSVVFNGTITAKKKEENRQKFIEDPEINFIFGNTQSLGVGVDGLQKSGACTIVFLEFPWNPADIDQAIARLWRDGFKGEKGINVYFFVGQGTIEEELIERLDVKKGVTQAVIAGEDVEDKDLLTSLMEKYLEEARELKRTKSTTVE